MKVSGTVKFKDGSLIPVPEAGNGPPHYINFRPVGNAAPGKPMRSAGGQIKADGTFEATTIKDGDGLIPGKYRITIFGPSVPEKYTKPETSGLEFDIQKPTSDLRIELDKP